MPVKNAERRGATSLVLGYGVRRIRQVECERSRSQDVVLMCDEAPIGSHAVVHSYGRIEAVTTPVIMKVY
jgi:hypothetical protein